MYLLAARRSGSKFECSVARHAGAHRVIAISSASRCMAAAAQRRRDAKGYIERLQNYTTLFTQGFGRCYHRCELAWCIPGTCSCTIFCQARFFGQIESKCMEHCNAQLYALCVTPHDFPRWDTCSSFAGRCEVRVLNKFAAPIELRTCGVHEVCTLFVRVQQASLHTCGHSHTGS